MGSTLEPQHGPLGRSQQPQILSFAEWQSLAEASFRRQYPAYFQAVDKEKLLSEAVSALLIEETLDLETCVAMLHQLYLCHEHLRQEDMARVRDALIAEFQAGQARREQPRNDDEQLAMHRFIFLETNGYMNSYSSSDNPRGFTGTYFDENVNTLIGIVFQNGFQLELQQAALELGGEAFLAEMVNSYLGMVYKDFQDFKKALSKMSDQLNSVEGDSASRVARLSEIRDQLLVRYSRVIRSLEEILDVLATRGISVNSADSFDDYRYLASLKSKLDSSLENFLAKAREHLTDFSSADLESLRNEKTESWLGPIVEEKKQAEEAKRWQAQASLPTLSFLGGLTVLDRPATPRKMEEPLEASRKRLAEALSPEEQQLFKARKNESSAILATAQRRFSI